MFTGKRPDITPAQLVTALSWIVSQAVAFGLLDTQRSQVILSVGSTIVTAAWQVADSIIRHGRNQALKGSPPPTP